MGLRINQNIAAMNSYRNLSTTDNQLSKSLEKLSSGFRINRAADDAAGLAISEGLRSQVGGLKVAVRNSQDGISVVQTAEGALNESHSILQRMRDLSVQASNDGGLNAKAKDAIQKEVTELASELTRIADTTKFNGKELLKGSYDGAFQVGANVGEKIGVTVNSGAAGKGFNSADLGVGALNVTTAGSPATTTMATGAKHETTVNFTAFSDVKALGTVTVNGKAVNFSDAGITDVATLNTALSTAGAGATASYTTGGKLTLTSTTSANVADLSVTGPAGVAGTETAGTTTTTAAVPSGAEAAITAIDTAIEKVSTARADLGAKQNRFEHTINNLNVTVENLSASESRIRDADMAQEMMQFTRNQILSQAGTSMLSQANQGSQGVLSLLR